MGNGVARAWAALTGDPGSVTGGCSSCCATRWPQDEAQMVARHRHDPLPLPTSVCSLLCHMSAFLLGCIACCLRLLALYFLFFLLMSVDLGP